jgi:7-cyano-7-deazaguanine synthase
MSGPRRRACVLVSGGIDSSALLAELLAQGREVYPLYVRSGLYWEKVELSWLRRFLKAVRSPRLKPLTVVDVPLSGLMSRHWSVDGRGVPAAKSAWTSVYLPGRNLILLGEAGLFCSLRRIPVIAQGILKGNPFGDATPRFRKLMERITYEALGFRVRIVAPYAKLTKAQVVGRAAGLPLELTFSCLKPRGSAHCGRCSKCEEREQCLEARTRS